MESPESSSPHDLFDVTEKVPSSWLADEADLDGPPTLVAPPTQRRPIPSILQRNATAPLAPAVADRIDRASVGAPLHLTPPPPAKAVAIARLTKPEPAKVPAKAPALSTVVHAKARISSEQVVPDSALWMNDITSRRTIPLRPPAEIEPAPEPAKIEIDWEPPVETVSLSESAKVEIGWEPPVEVAPEKVEVNWEPANAVEPADEVEPATLNAAVEPAPALVEPAPIHVEPAASDPAPRKSPSRKNKTKRNAGRRQPRAAVDPTTATVDAAAPAFGAGMLQSNNVRAKPAQRAPEPPAAAAPAFGAGMLQSRRGRMKREDRPAPALPSAAASTFGAGMLQARKSRAGLIAAMVLAAAAITAGYLATRGDTKPAAAALQK